MTRWGFRIGNLHFRPRLGWGIAAAAFVALTISLGNWQMRRVGEKIEAARRVDDAMRSAVLSVPSRPAVLAEFEHDAGRVDQGLDVAASRCVKPNTRRQRMLKS